MKRFAIGVAVLSFVLAAATPAFGATGPRQWAFNPPHHLKDSKAGRITDGDFFSGRIRFIDNFVTSSQHRYRNQAGGPRKRVYLIQGTVAIRNKDDYEVLGVSCRQKVGAGSFMLLTTQGPRAFYPRPAEHIAQHQSEGSVGLALGPFSVSLPFPAFSYYTSTSTAPNVGWSSLSSQVHNWGWGWDDGHPNDVLLGFAGYWAGPAKKIRYRLRCKVITVTDGLHLSQGVTKLKRTVHH